MSIDWFTFTAQILNFLLLVWLLKHFLYGPITTAMQQREARICAKLSDAEQAQKTADLLQSELQTQLREQANSKDELLATAGREIDSWRKSQLTASQTEVETARAQWYATLQREKQSIIQQLQLDIAHQATSLCDHLLQQLADERLQTRIVTKFLSVLAAEAKTPSKFGNLMADSDSILIESSHDLTQQEQSSITEAIQCLGASQSAMFRVTPELICGIQLRSSGCKLAWSIADSLSELETRLSDSIQQLIPIQLHNSEFNAEKLAAQ